jgi:hypothetical protein
VGEVLKHVRTAMLAEATVPYKCRDDVVALR